MSRGSAGLADGKLVVLDENNSSISTFDGEKWDNRFIENFEIGQMYQLMTIKDAQSETWVPVKKFLNPRSKPKSRLKMSQ